MSKNWVKIEWNWVYFYLLVKATNSKTGSTISGRSSSIRYTLVISLTNSIHNCIWCITWSGTFPIRKWNNRKQRKWFFWKKNHKKKCDEIFYLLQSAKKKSKGQKSETKPWPSFANDVCPWWNSIGKINVVINIHIILY